MSCDNYKERIISVIVKTLSVDINEIKLNSNTSINDDLGADSLDGVEILMGIEKEFNIAISDELAEKLLSKKPTVTVGDVIKFYESIFIKEIRQQKINKLNEENRD